MRLTRPLRATALYLCLTGAVVPMTSAAARAQGVGAPTTDHRPPAPVEGDFVLRRFAFQSGDTLPELRVHYRTLGRPVRDARGHVRNAVLVMHGTTGDGSGFLSETFAGHLFGPGQLLDATRYFNMRDS